jgi:hypothetical protein
MAARTCQEMILAIASKETEVMKFKLTIFLGTFSVMWLSGIALGFWAIRHSFPVPGPEPKEFDAWEEMATRIFDLLIFPARWSGGGAFFVGTAIWALFLSGILVLAWRLFRPRKLKLQP